MQWCKLSSTCSCLTLQAKIIEEKIPWIEYNDMQEAFLEGKKKLKESEEALTARKRQYDESVVPIGCAYQLPCMCARKAALLSHI